VASPVVSASSIRGRVWSWLSIDDVEQPSAHHDGAGRGRRLLEDLGVDRVLRSDPVMERVLHRVLRDAVLKWASGLRSV
jgi:hypothetical protein